MLDHGWLCVVVGVVLRLVHEDTEDAVGDEGPRLLYHVASSCRLTMEMVCWRLYWGFGYSTAGFRHGELELCCIAARGRTRISGEPRCDQRGVLNVRSKTASGMLAAVGDFRAATTQERKQKAKRAFHRETAENVRDRREEQPGDVQHACRIESTCPGDLAGSARLLQQPARRLLMCWQLLACILAH